jgi:serine/threonine protein kinase
VKKEKTILFHDASTGHKGVKGGLILGWPQGFNICLGVAQGLHYLHALVDPKIIDRDINASNILLDKIAGFKIWRGTSISK